MLATLPSRRAFGALMLPPPLPPHLPLLWPLTLAAVLAGCASAPTPGTKPGPVGSGAPPLRSAPAPDRDGPEANPPKNLAQVPDAEPKLEPTPSSGGTSKPYEVLGRQYVPLTHDKPFTQRGLASWYGRKFHGKRTANGEIYDMYAMTAAHPTLPLPSYARVRNPANGREVVVRINDRGPFHPGRIIDLSYTAALKLDVLRGVAPVELERITPEAIRSGSWRRGAVAAAAARTPVETAAADVAVAANSTPAPAPESAAAPTPALPVTEATTAPLAPPPRTAAGAAPAAEPADQANQPSGYWIQLGAFRQRDGAEDFQRRVAAEIDWLGDKLAVFSDAPLYRLQAGPYASRDEARGAAERIRGALQLVPVVLERR